MLLVDLVFGQFGSVLRLKTEIAGTLRRAGLSAIGTTRSGYPVHRPH
jgi:hypothetical protein